MDKGYIVHNLGLLVGVGLFFIAGAVIHSFIGVVTICDWIKGRTMTAVDKMITSLSIARVVFQLACLINMFLEIYYKDSLLFSVVKQCGDFTELLSGTICIGLFTLLTFVICLKISNIHHAYFQHLKFILAQRIVHLIAVVVVLSVVHTAVFMWRVELLHNRNATDDYIINYYEHEVVLQYIYFYATGNAVPFLIQMTSSLLLIYSLCIHVKRMKCRNNLTTLVDPYYGVMRVIIFCFLNFALQIILTLTCVYHYKTVGPIISYVTWNFFPLMHSLYLIHTTSQVKNAFSQMLQVGRNCLAKGGHSESNSMDPVRTGT
ncbi:taste receptor type 2 member 3-like [Mantella aurantiaca]